MSHNQGEPDKFHKFSGHALVLSVTKLFFALAQFGMHGKATNSLTMIDDDLTLDNFSTISRIAAMSPFSYYHNGMSEPPIDGI